MITDEEREKYVLKTEQDERILEKIHELEKRELTKEEKNIIAFCKSQMKDGWRGPLEKFADKLIVKH